MITGAIVSHYKSIHETSLRFRNINVIVGPNGSGKSNILDALYFIRDCAVDDIDTAVTKRHGIDSLRQWSRTRPYNITIDISFKNVDGSGNYKVVISSSKGQYRIVEETGYWIGPHPRDRYKNDVKPEDQTSHFKRDETGNLYIVSSMEDLNLNRLNSVEQDELFLTFIARRSPLVGYMPFKPIADEVTSFSKYNIYPNTLRQAQLVSKESTLLEDGSNLASVLKRINSGRRFSANKEDIIAALQAMMPIVSDFQVKSAAGFYVPVLRVQENSGELHDFNLSQISDGTLRTLGLLAAFYQPNAPNRIGVEEPEQMIHPGALTVLHEAITSFVTARTRRQRQVFVTTHSPTFIDLFDPEDLIWARFNKGVTECGHVKRRQLDVIKQQLFTAGELLLAEGFF
ncbi:AAA family ATPase [Methylobacterium sp. GC_Met_1]|uniref:AAA family ATPase n=3 Tax=unclassified Methylobacterium TaxID=2615210 RepID=UPI002269AFB2